VIVSSSFRSIVGAAAGAFLLIAPTPLFAQTAQKPIIHPQLPPAHELARVSPTGSYLAARHASVQRDAAAAAAYYRSALRADPRNRELLERSFLSLLAAGEIDEAVRLAERTVKFDREDRIARLVLGVRALRQKNYQTARKNLAMSVRGPITDLAAVLLSGWAQYGSGDVKGAVAGIDRLQGADWYALFKDFHAGLILDGAGQRREAARRLERAYGLDQSALRLVEAYASVLSRTGRRDRALEVLEAFDAQLPRHPLVTEAMAALKKKRPLARLVTTPQEGAAEVLYGLGAALGRRGGEDLGLVYLQLALYLVPDQPMALLSLADLYEQMKQPEQAIRTYGRLSDKSPLRRNADIQMATNLDSVDKTDEAKARLEKLIAAHPDDLEAIMALGNILRVRRSFDECADVYGRGIKTIAKPERPHWLIYYFRGICRERSKDWPGAEADLKTALELYPDQPHVLNYIGYSWIDQGINLDDGMKMIRRAVEQRPDDGYIVDSLGWAHYRLGQYDEAVKHLERAVELRPHDPTINDHLGDGYWQVGRFVEAKFQWNRARDLKPEDPEDLKRINEKIENGLDEKRSPSANAKTSRPDGG